MSEHLDLDALADVLAGVAAPEHLDTCTACRSRLAELSAALPAVAASLAALPPAVEPAALADRVSASLASARAEQPAGKARQDVLPLAARRTGSSRLWKAVAAVAAAAVLVTGAVLALQRDGHKSTQATRTWHASATGTDYGAGASALSKQLPALLAGTARPASTGAQPETATSTRAAADPLARLRTTAGLAQCLVALSDPGQAAVVPLALDYAAYKSQPALVVVLPSGKADKVDVFVVGAACAPADAKLLFFARLPKP